MADGGANQLYDMVSNWPSANGTRVKLTDYIPDIIEGDLDSIRPDVREFYRRLGTRQAVLHSLAPHHAHATRASGLLRCAGPEGMHGRARGMVWPDQDHGPVRRPGQHGPAEVPGVRLAADRGQPEHAGGRQHLCSRRAPQ